MSREEAARYVGVGVTKFDELVADRRMPRPKRIDGRVVWDRLKLDMAFTDLPEQGNAIDEALQARRNANPWDQDPQHGLPPADEATIAMRAYIAAGGYAVMAEGRLWSMDAFAEHIEGQPLNKLEIKTLRGFGSKSDNEIVFGGGATMDRLAARGYVTLRGRGQSRAPEYRLTKAGTEAAASLKSD